MVSFIIFINVSDYPFFQMIDDLAGGYGMVQKILLR